MKRNMLIFGVTIIFLVILCVAIVLFFVSKPINSYSIQSNVIVDNAVGFNLQNDQLYFGRVTPGGSATRHISFTSPTDVVITISLVGEIADWLILPENPLILVANETQRLSFGILVPAQAEFGNYSDTITFTYYRPFMKVFT